jgi:hypothetical protein
MAVLDTQIILRGTRAAQPAAAATKKGAIYCVTNENNILERNTGVAWEAYSPAAGVTSLTGDVTGTGPGATAATIANDAVTNAKAANMAEATLKGRAAGAGTGDPTDLSKAQAQAILGIGTTTLGIVIDGGGAVIATGVHGDLRIPFACTITKATLLADQSGSIVIDVWKDTYANFPPTVADTITAAAKPTLSGAAKSEDSTLTGWTTAVAAGDVLRFNVDSVATVTRVVLQLDVTY